MLLTFNCSELTFSQVISRPSLFALHLQFETVSFGHFLLLLGSFLMLFMVTPALDRKEMMESVVRADEHRLICKLRNKCQSMLYMHHFPTNCYHYYLLFINIHLISMGLQLRSNQTAPIAIYAIK